MATTGIGNPAGAVQVFDFGAPHFVPGVARAATVSGGTLCFGSTATGVVSSGPTSFSPGSILFVPNASGAQFNGVAMYTAGSNLPLAVAVGGIFLLQCDGTVTTGQPVITGGNNAVADGVTAGQVIGRALTAGASGGYCLVQISP